MHGLKCIFFYVPLRPSGVLHLVETLEGEVLVLRDGQPYGGYRWKGEQIPEAVDEFRRVAANLQRESWAHEVFRERQVVGERDASAVS
jgi:hypothetical protein